ncbi:MAG TPA: alpha/beta fold hydrolase [Acidisarcina sp.]
MSSAPPEDATQSATADAGVQTARAWLRPFLAPWYLRNGHLQTIVGNFLPRSYSLPEPEARWIEVEGASGGGGVPTELVCQCHWQREPGSRPTMLLLHGLEGSSSSQYVLGNAAGAWAAGWNVVRMNMRSCGGGEERSPSLYHSGRSEDVRRVVAELAGEYSLEAVALVGYSMGGNMVLKLAGELGGEAGTLPALKAVVGVSPLMDLSASSDALHEPANRVYERRFLRAMLRRFERKAEIFPAVYREPRPDLRKIRTMRDFDEQIVARYSGFEGAEDYYTQVSSSRVADRIAAPTLILHALDDPFIRMRPETRLKLLGNPQVTLVETRHGGHCAFLSGERGNERYWAEKTLLGYLEATIGGGPVGRSY